VCDTAWVSIQGGNDVIARQYLSNTCPNPADDEHCPSTGLRHTRDSRLCTRLIAKRERANSQCHNPHICLETGAVQPPLTQSPLSSVRLRIVGISPTVRSASGLGTAHGLRIVGGDFRGDGHSMGLSARREWRRIIHARDAMKGRRCSSCAASHRHQRRHTKEPRDSGDTCDFANRAISTTSATTTSSVA